MKIFMTSDTSQESLIFFKQLDDFLNTINAEENDKNLFGVDKSPRLSQSETEKYLIFINTHHRTVTTATAMGFFMA